jgi:hypothetical protein
MTIYDLLRLLVDNSAIADKVNAHELIRELEAVAALGSMATTTSVGDTSHVHIQQQEWEDSRCQRYILRCATCRTILSEPWWPTEHDPRWRK